MSSLFTELEQRGLIAQLSSLNAPALFAQVQKAYCGFDPTAGSLHIGHLVPLLMLKRFSDANHDVIALVGGATGMIGDPSFKAQERLLNTGDTVTQWANQLSEQIRQLMDPHLRKPLTVVNNSDWLGSLNLIDFFRTVGKHFSVNAMIRRDAVKLRLERPDQGISFTEFSYSLLQSYDFAILNKQFGCTLQIGGNDQWGNIVSGIDLTRRLNNAKVDGMTLPLITKADGTKFGKTETDTIWLDAKKTSPYRFYQFWLNTDDADVQRLLGYYTFLSCAEIAALIEQDKTAQGKPSAQRILAEAVTRFVHGDAGLAAAQRITAALFCGRADQLSLPELQQLELDGLPAFGVNRADTIAAALVKSGLATSNNRARELLASGAVRINGEPAGDGALLQHFALFDRFWVLQRGARSFCLLTQSA